MRRSRLLVVDDDRDTLALFEIYFSAAGFDVTSVTTASEALARIEEGFDAITTDLAMPGIDGFQFIKRVRQTHARPMPIVAVTGQFLAAVQGTVPVDCCRVIGKPCDLESVADLLHWLIRACRHDCRGCENRQLPQLLKRDSLPHEPSRA